MSKTGLKPKQRKLAVTTDKTKITGNQWQNTPQQRRFIEYWTDVSSNTFGNAYKSALKAEYSEHYARVITTKAPDWLNEYKGLSSLQLQHIEQKLIDMITGKLSREESNSPADTTLKAIELYSRVTGILDQKNTINVNLVQPILGGQSVDKAKIIDQEGTNIPTTT